MSDRDEAARYHRLQLWLGLAGFALGAAYLLAVLASGAAEVVAEIAATLTDGWWAQVVIVAVLLGGAQAVIAFPLGWVRGFWLPRRFGLLHQPFGAWLADRAKAAALGGALALGGLLVLYGLLRATPWWWLVAAAVFFVVGIALSALFPVVIMPMFYTLTRLADPALERRLLALAERAGVMAIGVWVVDQSRKSRTANAAVLGLGRTRRIVLFDTLTTGFREEEIEAVLAHELAHHVHGDLRRGLIVQGVLTLATFWLAAGLLAVGVGRWGITGPADPAGLPWLALVFMLLGAVQLPLANAFSRRIERQADDFGLTLTRNPAAFIAAMERLGALNLAERRPHRLKEILLYSHPALDRRIARARGEAV
ncbi:MAG TPA: M48 family metallopeptidase [Methylomirabilota bacterium]|nr:M48 family metallopeptidase [Methylomirabilota bacterium]